ICVDMVCRDARARAAACPRSHRSVGSRANRTGHGARWRSRCGNKCDERRHVHTYWLGRREACRTRGSGWRDPGGGIIVHHFVATNTDAMGVYVVTGFISWQPGGGQLQVADGIGHASEASAGILKMAIRIFLPSGAFVDATL